jgi:peptidoglycan-associated lipoprotein
LAYLVTQFCRKKGKIMKISIARRAASLALLGATALILAACSSVKLDDVNGDSGSGGSGGNFASQPWNDPKSPLYERSVYFDFNEYTVQTKYQKTLSAHASYLKANPKQKVIIQGNTDERGTAEYNLALGQRRSDAVRKSLNLMGVSDDQMEAVSFGKEKPKAEGDNEAAWAENRRADIVYITN